MKPVTATFKPPLSDDEIKQAEGRAAMIAELHEVEARANHFEAKLKEPEGIVGHEHRTRVEARVQLWRDRAHEIVKRLWPLSIDEETG